MSLKISTKGFKKINGDQHFTQMQHPDGHSITINHRHLSPKWKAQLIALPTHSGATPEKMEEAHTAPKAKSMQSNKVAVGLAEGGDVHKNGEMAEYHQEPNSLSRQNGAIFGAIAHQPKMFMADGGGVLPNSSQQPNEMDSIMQQASATDAAAPQVDTTPQQLTPPQQDNSPVIEEYNRLSGNFPPAMYTKNEQGQYIPGQSFREDLFAKAKQNVAARAAAAPGIQAQEYKNIEAKNQLRAEAGQPALPLPPVAPAALEPTPQEKSATGQGGPSAMPSQQKSDQQNMFGIMREGVKEEEAGLGSKLGAEAQYGADSYKASRQASGQMQELKLKQENDNRAAQEHFATLEHDIQQGYIKPNHYMESLDTGAKVSTAIGLLLGGIGGGATGQGNVALDFLNKQIDRDIRSQETNLSSKTNLMHYWTQHTRNMIDARAATRATIIAGYQAEMDKALAKSRTPQAVAAYQLAHGQLQQQKGMLLSGIGTHGDIGQMDPAMAIRMMVPQHEQAAATKELGEAQELTRAHNNMLQAIDEVSKLQTVAQRVGSPLQTPQRIHAIMESRIAELSKATAGRLTPQDVEMLRSLVPRLTSNPETVAIMKREASKLISEKAVAPTMQKYFINPFQGLKNASGATQGSAGRVNFQLDGQQPIGK